MADPRFFAEKICTGPLILSEAESHHAARVQRLSAGNWVELFDGKGTWGRGKITKTERRNITIEVDAVGYSDDKPTISLTIATAIPKTARQNVLFEKCTELGVSTIVPLVTTRSVVNPRPNSIEKWNRVTIEAAKQCGRNRIPTITAPASLEESISRLADTRLKCLAHPCNAGASLGRLLMENVSRDDNDHDSVSLAVWIGPEGGWSDEEIALASDSEMTKVSLGPYILRLETAVIAAAAVVAGFGNH
jgi:16S rRNA (uracil1498-N3)-methyltransferase